MAYPDVYEITLECAEVILFICNPLVYIYVVTVLLKCIYSYFNDLWKI